MDIPKARLMVNDKVRAVYYLMLNEIRWIYDQRMPLNVYLSIKDHNAGKEIIRNVSKFEAFDPKNAAEKILRTL